MRDLITTLFEVFGLLLLAVGAGVALAAVHPALGIAGCGLVLIGESFLVDLLGAKPKPDSGDVA